MSKYIIEKVYQDLKDGIISTNSITVEAEGVWKDLEYTKLKLIKPRPGTDRYYCSLYKGPVKALKTTYARYLMSLYIEELIDQDLDVDHINNNRHDDYIWNLQILDKTTNFLKHIENDLDRQSELLDKCVQDYREGLTYDDIAKKRNLHKSTIVNYIAKSGTQRRATIVYNDEDLKKKIVEEYQKNTPLSEMMDLFNISHTTINRIVDESGIEKRKTTKEEMQSKIENIKDKVIDFYKNGHPIADIVRITQASPTLINVMIKKHDLERRHKAPTSVKDNHILRKSIIEDYQNGMLNKDIAIKHNIGTDTLNYILTQEGIQKKRKILTEPDRLERNKRIINDFIDGMSPSEIAKQYDMTTRAIYNIIQTDQAYDEHMAKREERLKSRPTEEEIKTERQIKAQENRRLLQQIGELKAKGLSDRAVGRELNISHKRVPTYMNIINIDMPIIQKINNYEVDTAIFKNVEYWIRIRDYIDREAIERHTLIKGAEETKGSYFVKFAPKKNT